MDVDSIMGGNERWTRTSRYMAVGERTWGILRAAEAVQWISWLAFGNKMREN